MLTLTTQLVWSLVAESEGPSRSQVASQPQGIVGALYRSAALKATPSEKEIAETAAGASRGQRCVRCGANGSGYYGNYADR